jgi:hypothetical protein
MICCPLGNWGHRSFLLLVLGCGILDLHRLWLYLHRSTNLQLTD